MIIKNNHEPGDYIQRQRQVQKLMTRNDPTLKDFTSAPTDEIGTKYKKREMVNGKAKSPTDLCFRDTATTSS